MWTIPPTLNIRCWSLHPSPAIRSSLTLTPSVKPPQLTDDLPNTKTVRKATIRYLEQNWCVSNMTQNFAYMETRVPMDPAPLPSEFAVRCFRGLSTRLLMKVEFTPGCSLMGQWWMSPAPTSALGWGEGVPCPPPPPHFFTAARCKCIHAHLIFTA